MLFSEPKIPQFRCDRQFHWNGSGFQCSSASRKFLNRTSVARRVSTTRRFSALQRAENSSIGTRGVATRTRNCFSALQRAENSSIPHRLQAAEGGEGFSALQRAENSSIFTLTLD